VVELKRYNAKHLVIEFLSISWTVGSVYTLLQKPWVIWSVDHRSDNADLVNELSIHKNRYERNNIYTLYIYYLID